MLKAEAKKAIQNEIATLESIEANHFRPDDLREDMDEPLRRLRVIEMKCPEAFTPEVQARIAALRDAIRTRQPPPGYVVPGTPLDAYDIPDDDPDKHRFWG